MNKNMFLLAGLLCLVLMGLTAGIFMDSIQSALTLPARSPMILPTQQAMQQKQLPAPQAMPSVLASQGVQTILAQDTFQRADQTLWGTASDGRQWGGDANMLTNNFLVNGNHGQITNGNGTFNALLGTPGGVKNAEDMLDGSLSHFDGAVNLGVVLRYQDPDNWYKAFIDGKHLTVLKNVQAKSTTLASVAFVAQDDQSYSLRFRVVGDMLFARVWPSGTPEPAAWMITIADTTFQSGQVGIRVVLRPGLTVAVTSFAATIPDNNI
jgi:hypothetical protein